MVHLADAGSRMDNRTCHCHLVAGTLLRMVSVHPSVLLHLRMVYHQHVRGLPTLRTEKDSAGIFGHEGHQDVLLAHRPAHLFGQGR